MLPVFIIDEFHSPNNAVLRRHAKPPVLFCDSKKKTCQAFFS